MFNGNHISGIETYQFQSTESQVWRICEPGIPGNSITLQRKAKGNCVNREYNEVEYVAI